MDQDDPEKRIAELERQLAEAKAAARGEQVFQPAPRTPPSNSPAAGWYPDPAGSSQLRYFDGRNWTNHFHPVGVDVGRMQRLADEMRQGHITAGNVAEMVQLARQAQAQAMSQTAGGGLGELMASLGMDYGTDYVMRVDCPSCGGPKKLPSPSAYLYCDYCGALADYDFHKACQGHTLPGPQYRQLVNASQGELRAAKAAGDRDAYRRVQRRIFDAYATFCPNALSHRIADPEYRGKVVDFMAENAVITDFDPGFAAMEDEVTAGVRNLTWTGSVMARRAGSASFRALVEVVLRHLELGMQLAAAAALADRDPDHASVEVRRRMSYSAFAQAWLPFLEQDDAAWLVAELKLSREYTKIEPAVGASTRRCGACGGDLTVLPGARTIVCDHCGKAIDVAGTQATCTNCGAGLSFPVGVRSIQCPDCKCDTARIGWT